jgi:hypothetical protein
MAELRLGIDLYGEHPVLSVIRKDGHKLRVEGDYMLADHTDKNGAGVVAYPDPIETWEDLAWIVKDFLGE